MAMRLIFKEYKNMKAEILSTGNEVLTGAVNDTNSAWLASKLIESGIAMERMVCVGDDVKAIAAALSESAERADIVLVTGGLGPTDDDLTARAAALAADDRIVMNRTALLEIQNYFKEKGWNMPEINRKQAELPSKACIIENTAGTAPGFYMDMANCLLVFMPGVPLEMKRMFKTGVKSLIEKRSGLKEKILLEKITIFGLPEAEVNIRLREFNENFSGLILGFRANFPLIEVKLFCETAKDHEHCDNSSMKDAKNWVAAKLGRRVVSREGLSMEEEVGRLLTAKKATIAVAESCTGGLIADMLTNIPGSSDYFLFSGVTYSNYAKVNILGVHEDTIIKNGAVHEDTAMQMAKGARKVSNATYGISTSGIAGPGGGTIEKPIGTVCIGIAGPDFARAKRYIFSFSERSMNKKMFAITALELLRRELTTGSETARFADHTTGQ